MTHLFDGDLVDHLRDLADIDDLLRHFSASDAAFWDELCARAVRLDVRRPAYYCLRYASLLLATPVPERVQAAARRWGPPAPVRWLMDRLVPLALFPAHPDHPSKASAAAGFLLYLRFHWIRMPPWLLAYHLTVKFIQTTFTRRQRPDD